MESGGVFFWSGQEGGKLTKLTNKKIKINLKKNNNAKNKTKQTNKKASNLLVAFILYAENAVTN
jgi:hypothetical protein